MPRPRKLSRKQREQEDSGVSDGSSNDDEDSAGSARREEEEVEEEAAADVIDLTSEGGEKVMDVTEASSKGGAGGENADDASSSADDEEAEGGVRVESAAFGAEQAQLDESDGDSNLADVEPEVGMEIDFRDPDYIWSSAKIVKVSRGGKGRSSPKKASGKGSKKLEVTVRYDGWPSDWDEVVPWPCVRVARLFTYTKRVKCLADGILSIKKHCGETLGDDGRKIVHCSYWPSMVRFRMPHPAHKARADELLRLEPNVFVQPYGLKEELLPGPLACALCNGGFWLHSNKLRKWRDADALDPLGILFPNFDLAHKLAMEDTSTPGRLPTKPMEIGSLLNADYRVFTLGGEPVNGLMYTGATLDHPKPKPKPITTKAGGCLSKVDRKLRSDEGNEIKKQLRPRVERPPSLPTPFAILESPHSSSEVVRLNKTQMWGAAISIGGNDLFLGSFPSQTHAAASSELAFLSDSAESTKQLVNSKKHFPKDEERGRIADLNSVKLADSICALERSGTMQTQDNFFSIHEWTMQNIRYHAYLKEKSERSLSGADGVDRDGDEAEETNGPNTKKRPLPDGVESKRKRKQSKPRRLDLTKRVYV